MGLVDAPSFRSAALSVCGGSLLLLSGCVAESTHLPPAALGTDTPAVTVAGATPSAAAAAYTGEERTAVEASADALAKGSVPTAQPKPTGFSLFSNIDDGASGTTGRMPKIVRSSARKPKVVTRVAARSTVSLNELPGVRRDSLAVVKGLGRSAARKVNTLSEPVRVASAAALGRIGKHGLRTQHSKVSVGCLKPSLVKLIKRAERHFGRYAVVTSGYRSPRHNRRIGGARGSMHVSCSAADIQIKGVTKWKLAAWLRKQPGRGGVGTYCHTQSVHLDIGKVRDWNWRCKRRKGKRRRA